MQGKANFRTAPRSLWLLWLFASLSFCRARSGGPPHILFILADDVGWNDVGWRDGQMFTPNLDQMARGGVVLDQAYMQPSCSPSRAALMTGIYPFRLGLQHTVIQAGKVEYLTDRVAILPQYLKQLGYRTHLVGKWHLGFCDWKYTPTYRGFDSFYGYYSAIEGYYNHRGKRYGYDFRDNEAVDWSAKGTYSTHLFAARAQRIIRNHNPEEPLFLLLSFQAVHSPMEVPRHYIESHCSHVADRERRVLCGMLAAMDEGVGNVTDALREAGLAEDTLVIFTSDNGGPGKMGASNWPLRGAKTTLWEGGTRAASFVYSSSPTLVPARGVTFSGLIHVVDWLPTLLAVAEGRGQSAILPQNIDGLNLWHDLQTASCRSRRREMVYNIDQVKRNAAIRVGRWKLIEGRPGKPQHDPPEGCCARRPKPRAPGKEEALFLFDLLQDPSETRNVVRCQPRVVRALRTKLQAYREGLVPPLTSKTTPAVRSSDPALHNDTWSPGFCSDSSSNKADDDSRA